ncbi:hypothetical protein BC829DRAFT_421311 [Chytridium lagenaria]|nr:hypothetical protein BC829DRAFT_421311 [Chytridium lagenaria]
MSTATAQETSAFAEQMKIRAARKGNQFRALGFKALSYQKRQVFTNICCISLCPLFMVAISAILGTVIAGLIQRSNPVEDVLYCGNNNSLTDIGFPNFNSSSNRIYGSNNTPVSKSFNYVFVLSLAGLTGSPGAALVNVNNPCVRWFGADYPANSPIYERNANSSLLAKLDSTYVPPPNGGWLATFQNPRLDPADIHPSHVFKQNNGPDEGPVSNIAQFFQSLASANSSYAPYTTTKRADGSYGLLGSLETRFFLNLTSANINASNPTASISVNHRLDSELERRFKALLNAIASLDKSALDSDKRKNATLQIEFQSNVNKITSTMPYGSIFLDAYDPSELSARVVLQFGRDKRLDTAATFPTQGFRQIIQYTQLGQSFLRSFNSSFSLATLTQGVRAFPSLENTKFDLPFGGLIGRILYPFGVSFLLPIFVIVLVKEKEDRILMMMKMNGMKDIAYYISHYITFYILFAISSAIFLIAGRFNRLDLFTQTEMSPGDEVFNALIFMIFETIFFLFASFYLSAVLPSDFGVRKSWHWPITDPIQAFQRAQRKKLNGGIDPLSESNLAVNVKIDEEETKFEDADVKAERDRISRVYAGRRGLGPKLAVKDVTFAAEQGLIFGLLGPNGAGKTTLISILTGLYEASSGNATLAGFNYKSEQDSVYKVIGVCPQFDILWEDLTVGEHLYFYARLKGVPVRDEKVAVQKALANVSLTTLESRKTKGLSGGEKRRLSIAIALIGDPAVVFLDEPTTGLDPEVRRLIWNIVTNAREGKTIILTTHSMEEAEALCQRIGIMAKGTLRCLSNPIRLKDLYGSGFKLFFNSLEEDTSRAAAWIESLMPKGWTKVDALLQSVISYLFQTIEAGKSENGILDWGISQTTLEEVFLRIISDDDANAD